MAAEYSKVRRRMQSPFNAQGLSGRCQFAEIIFIKEKYRELYIPLYAHAMPLRMIVKNPQYVLNYSIIPTYTKIISFKKVRPYYFKYLDLSDIPQNGQLLMLKAITGFASGIALANNRQILTKEDIEIAKTLSCDYYPKCGAMLAEKLFQLNEKYQKGIRKPYWEK